jgi:cell division transport system permease protein
MFLRSIPFLIREAFLNLRRQGLMTLASISTVAVALSILGAFGLLAWHVHLVTDQLPRRFEVHAFLRRNLPAAEVEGVRGAVERIPGVRSVTLVTCDEAWNAFKNRYTGLKSDLEGLEGNPLPDKLEIQAHTPQQTLAVAEQVRVMPQVEAVQDGRTVLQRLISINQWVRTGSLILGALLALGTVAIISNAIRLTLFARRREIRVMQLVGATNGFVRFPFLLEGMLDGLIGGGLACGLLYLAYHYLTTRALVHLPLVSEFRLNLDLPVFLGGIAAGGLMVGFMGSAVSIRRFLKI